jgi:hypothetical protein
MVSRHGFRDDTAPANEWLASRVVVGDRRRRRLTPRPVEHGVVATTLGRLLLALLHRAPVLDRVLIRLRLLGGPPLGLAGLAQVEDLRHRGRY